MHLFELLFLFTFWILHLFFLHYILLLFVAAIRYYCFRHFRFT